MTAFQMALETFTKTYISRQTVPYYMISLLHELKDISLQLEAVDIRNQYKLDCC